MRRIIIWILVILLVAGFIYTGNNLLKANGYTVSEMFPMQYIPKTNFLAVAEGPEYLKLIFPSVSYSYPFKRDSSQIIYLSDNDNSVSYIKMSRDTQTEITDSILYNFRINSYNTNLEWENGFPLIEASNLNKMYFASSWRKWAFFGNSKYLLEKMFSTILGKKESIKKDTDFQLLWRSSKAPLYGMVYKNGKEIFEEKMKIPFVHFKFPAFFEYDKNVLSITNESSLSQGTLFFEPFDFSGALLEIAMPDISDIKDIIDESGLQMIISEKLGFPFDKFSAFSSLNSGEFVLLNKRDFLFTVKSTPLSNSLYESELQNLSKDSKSLKEKINGFALITYQNASTKFYVLEMPSFFVISDVKQPLFDLANKSVKLANVGNSSFFMFVEYGFNDVINLYSLNVKPLVLPDFATYCTVTEMHKSDGKLLTKIIFGK